MQMTEGIVIPDICEPCTLWAAECFITSLATTDSDKIAFWYDYNRDQGGQIEYKSTRSVLQIYAGRKSCWFCARWWFSHRFWNRNGDLNEYEYHSDQELLQQFGRAPYHGIVELCVSAEFYLRTSNDQEQGAESQFQVGAWNFGSNSILSSYAGFQKTWLPNPVTDEWFPLDRIVSYELGKRGLRPVISALVATASPVSPGLAGEERQRATEHNGEVGHLTPDRIAIVKGWLRECGACHRCVSGRSPRPPTRLLHLEAGSFVRLVEWTELIADYPIEYATLSHCWGDSKADRLLQCNHSAWLHGFDESSLTRTNLQAIRICRALSIVYIWIDSLCIIQDSPGGEDWIAEAPKMDSVYGGSYLNISATIARSGLDGAIRVPARPLGKAMRIHIGGTDIAQSDTFTTPYYASAFRASPVNTRGWIQQEIFLARRVLHLTDEELIWTCRHALWSEITCADRLHQSDYQRLAPRPLEGQPHRTGSPINFDERWRWVARQFAGTTVTVDHDRYMALMGLAGFFSRSKLMPVIGTEYVVGCWTHSLLRDIMWIQQEPAQGYLKVHVTSWSWLKSEGKRLSFPIDEPANDTTSFESCAELVRVDKQLKFEELRYGPVVWATAHLRGPMMRIYASAVKEWADNLSDEPVCSSTSSDYIWTSATLAVGGEEVFLEAANEASCCFQDVNYMTMRMLEICWDVDLTDRGPDQTVIRCIWLWKERCWRSACWDDYLGIDYLGLLLEPVEATDPAAVAFRASASEETIEPLYKRIGTIKLPVTDPKMHEEGSPAHGALIKLNHLFNNENALVEDVVII